MYVIKAYISSHFSKDINQSTQQNLQQRNITARPGALAKVFYNIVFTPALVILYVFIFLTPQAL